MTESDGTGTLVKASASGAALVAGAALFLACSGAATQSVASQDLAKAEAAVRAREVAFAQTMADRDPEAFRSFLAEDAVFFDAAGSPLRGAGAVADAWRPFFVADTAPFSWRPDLVVVLESGRLALSTGPVLDPSGAPVGRFNTIWRLDADGAWRVVFDKGGS